jgi:hypothetical protein
MSHEMKLLRNYYFQRKSGVFSWEKYSFEIVFPRLIVRVLSFFRISVLQSLWRLKLCFWCDNLINCEQLIRRQRNTLSTAPCTSALRPTEIRYVQLSSMWPESSTSTICCVSQVLRVKWDCVKHVKLWSDTMNTSKLHLSGLTVQPYYTFLVKWLQKYAVFTHISVMYWRLNGYHFLGTARAEPPQTHN